jgi:hypothetical protein
VLEIAPYFFSIRKLKPDFDSYLQQAKGDENEESSDTVIYYYFY